MDDLYIIQDGTDDPLPPGTPLRQITDSEKILHSNSQWKKRPRILKQLSRQVDGYGTGMICTDLYAAIINRFWIVQKTQDFLFVYTFVLVSLL